MLRQRLTAGGVKYLAIAGTNLQNQLAYVWDTLNRSATILIFMFVLIKLWTAVYERQPSPEINGLTLPDTIWYFLIAEVMQLGLIRHDARITEEVRDGSIAYTLNKPYNYLAYHFSNGLGESVVKMALVFLIGAPLALVYAGMPAFRLSHLPYFALVFGLAVLVDFCMLSFIGLLAFVTEDTFSFRLIYQKITFILGGLLIPIDFLPDWLQRIARLLPFQLTTYAPARMFVAFDQEIFRHLVATGIVWLAILLVLLHLQYRWAARRLAINGG